MMGRSSQDVVGDGVRKHGEICRFFLFLVTGYWFCGERFWSSCCYTVVDCWLDVWENSRDFYCCLVVGCDDELCLCCACAQGCKFNTKGLFCVFGTCFSISFSAFPKVETSAV